MCGGGGGDGGASEREAQREAAMSDAISKINVLFGVDPNNGTAAHSPADGAVAPQDNSVVEGSSPIPKWQENKTAIDANLATTKDDIMKYFMTELDDQKIDEERLLKQNLARNGQLGSSVDIDAQAEIADKYDKGVFSLRNRADADVTGIRASDEKSRLSLIDRIRGGMDSQSAIAGAINQMTNSTAQAQQTALSDGVGDYMGGVADVYGYQRYNEGKEKGNMLPYKRNSGATVKHRGDSGTTYNS